MLRILVVDDEPRNRKGIINLIKVLRPDYILNEAKNGQEALKFIELNHVDILVTDIRMPIMDGLQLTEEVMKTKKDIKIIILSAYAYFEYAQRAIGLGAIDYLIKPVDQTKVMDSIVKVENKINSERNALLEKKKLEKQIESTLSVYKEDKLKRWLMGCLKEDEQYEIEEIFHYEGDGHVILCEIVGGKEQSISYSRDERDEINSNIKYWMNELLDSIGNSISFFQPGEDENLVLVSVVKINDGTNLNDKTNIQKFYELIENIKVSYNLELVLSISNICTNIKKNVKTVYNQASIAISYKFYYEGFKVIEFLNIEHCYNKPQLKRFKEEAGLLEAFAKGDRTKTLNIINKIIDNIVLKDVPHPQHLLEKVINIMLKLAEAVQTKLADEDYDELILDIKENLSNCSKLVTVKDKCEDLLVRLISLQEASKNNVYKNDRIMKKCIEYLAENYKDQIYLDEVAGKFYFNPSYFSGYFKNYTGVNFCDYLMKLRMNKSKELLEATNLKIYEIAAEVGYLDSKYFNRLFKNEFGVSPEEYRRAILGPGK